MDMLRMVRGTKLKIDGSFVTIMMTFSLSYAKSHELSGDVGMLSLRFLYQRMLDKIPFQRYQLQRLTDNLIVLPRCESHLAGSNIEYSQHIPQEHIAQDARTI